MSYEPNQNLIFLVALAFSFLSINYDFTLGVIYLGMILVFRIGTDDNPFIKFRLFKPGKTNFFNILAIAGIGYLIFYFSSGFLIGKIFGAQAITEALKVGTPALAQSEYLKIISVGILIPIVESMLFFGALPQVFAHLSKISLRQNYSDLGVLFTIIFVSAAFAIFHLTVRGITGTAGLFRSFLFGIVSMAMVLYTSQVADAVGLHIINNLHALGVFNP